MKTANVRVPKNIQELLEILSFMVVSAPKILDKTGYFPYKDLAYVFLQLNEGLSFNRPTLGEERYQALTRMSDEMRALFDADPEDKTGETAKGCQIILEMEHMLREAGRKS